MDINTIIIKPILTEHSIKLTDESKFTFHVSSAASKDMIRKAVIQKFNVEVVKITTSNVKGKRKRIGIRKEEVKVSSWKKATVTLKKGQKINMFDLGSEAK
ncbi:MAG: 50S ribosomal protein L23 [Candidatus Levybacteria bacterium]|nr:50S ribosomal protein L23 [Candidatus Levybacteria bacterium]